jgi:hypothetical protein
VSSAHTISYWDTAEARRQPFSGRWGEDVEAQKLPLTDWLRILIWRGPQRTVSSSVTGGMDPWLLDEKKEVRTVKGIARSLTISDLGWTREKAMEVRARLAAFAVDWDDPKMDIYNEP